ncbi:MAG: alpha/beta hydrolase [Alphaproteobacteria bacterium]|nr:alpha/beta hydrolase [Alphaproteobacteria bacterium]
MYTSQHPARSVFVPIRGLNYHLLEWGQPQLDQPTLFMVHGWMDVADSFQFMVDAMRQQRHILAPDWRGYGLTDAGAIDNFWFPDYLADLDALLDHWAPEGPVDLLGHSMGGNVAMMYAGVRPERVRKLINLEGFGMAPTRPAQAPKRYAQWLDELRQYRRGELGLKPYASGDAVAERLRKNNPRLSPDKAAWLAQRWARQDASGQWVIQGHAAHKIINANLYRVDEVQEIFARITAPTLCVVASDDSLAQWWKGSYTLEMFQERMKAVPQLSHARIEDAGHMLHHDQPQALARLIDEFLK